MLVAVALVASVATASARGAARRRVPPRRAGTPLQYGVSDDWPKYHPCGDTWWNAAPATSATPTCASPCKWDGTQHDQRRLEERGQLRRAERQPARHLGLSRKAQPDRLERQRAVAFASFVALVATTAGPTVTNFIVGNEPNVNRFWQPQYVNGQDAAGADYEHTLAKSYDALKAVRPDARVWGPAISSRGNDNANAASNPSHSPVWFIKDMGDAYRASGRTTPIFDVFDLHPYPPIQDTDPFTKPFQWPQAGAANLDRIKQALWDAFHGTGQPTPTEQPGGRTAQASRPRFSARRRCRSRWTRSASRPSSPATKPPTPTARRASRRSASSSRPPTTSSPDGARRLRSGRESLLFFPLIDEPDVHNRVPVRQPLRRPRSPSSRTAR